MFKKVAVTGHAAGIGKSFYDYFSRISEVKGFDIVNGYNIETPEKILEESRNCDLFINNACSDVNSSQAQLAEQWFNLHRNDPYFIIHISSILVKTDIVLPEPLRLYTDAKKKVEEIHNKINIESCNCRSIVVSPGIVDTPRVKRFDPLILSVYSKLKDNNSLLTADDVMYATVKNLEMINERYFPSLIEISNRKLQM